MTKHYLMDASRITTGSTVPTSSGSAGDLYVKNTPQVPSGYIAIGTPAELVAFAARVNAGETSLNAGLTADLDMTGVSYTPIGTTSNPYAGTFMGYGHSISNLSLVGGNVRYRGIFGYGNGCNISNINCTGFYYRNVGHDCATILGWGSGTITISNCGAYDCELNCEGDSGSIMGAGNGNVTISNCFANNCTINTDGSGSGGVVGAIYMGGSFSISNCYEYNCTISGTFCGGVVGYAGTTPTISNCAIYGGTHGGTINGSGSATTTNCYTSSTSGMTESIFKTQGFWDGTGVSGTTYLSWDFTDTWAWNSTSSLPKLQSVAVSVDTSLYAYGGFAWSLQNTVLDSTPTSASTNGVTSGGVYTSLSNKQDSATSSTVTLTVAGWDSSAKTQTISVTGVTASNTVFVSPSPSSFSDYGDAKIYCSAQGAGTLTFTCDTVPASAVTVNVVIL